MTSKTTVLIHGFGFDHRTWYPAELAFEGHHVIYLSLPGFGMERVEEPYTIHDLSKKYWLHINDVVKGPVNLVGHSMGGYVCLEMASLQPENVASLALVHSHVFADPPEKKEARNATVNSITSEGSEPFIKKFIPSLFADENGFSEISTMLVRRGLSYDDKAWIFGTQAIRDRSDHSETLKKLKVPVLSIMGEKDKAVPAELATKQASLAEQIVLHLYPDVGHLSMYENAPRLIKDLINFYDTVVA